MNSIKNFLKVLLIFLFVFTLFSCTNNNLDNEDDLNENIITVTFNVSFPKSTPSGNIYIAGDFKNDLMSDWDPGAESGLAIRDDNNATITLTYNKDDLPVNIEYKWVRGSWDYVEKDSNGREIPNRKIKITENIIINDIVERWADDMNLTYEPQSVIGNLDLVILSDNNFTNLSQQKRIVRIWTPTSYNKNDSKKYPVIYMHDGQNLFDVATSFSGEWEADETMELLIDNGFTGAIIVGIDNSIERMGEYVYNHEFLDGARFNNNDPMPNKTGHEYMNFLVNVVKPYVDSNYNTLKSRENTTIAGSSLGGLISLFGGLEHLETFGSILAFSTSTQLVNNEDFLNSYFSNLNTLAKDTKYFFYVGTNSDGNTNWPGNYKNKLKTFGVADENIQTYIGNGYTHNEHAWKTHLPIALKWLYNLN